MPIRTPRLLIRPKQPGDGAITSASVAETWDELHQWMRWAERPDAGTATRDSTSPDFPNWKCNGESATRRECRTLMSSATENPAMFPLAGRGLAASNESR